MKWERTKYGTYKYGDYRITKAPSGKITKGYGYDVFFKIKKIAHFGTLKEAKDYAESL